MFGVDGYLGGAVGILVLVCLQQICEGVSDFCELFGVALVIIEDRCASDLLDPNVVALVRLQCWA